MKNPIQLTKQAAPEGTVYKGDAYIMTGCGAFFAIAFLATLAAHLPASAALFFAVASGATVPWLLFHGTTRLWKAIRARGVPA